MELYEADAGVWDSGTSPDPHHWARAAGPRRILPELPRLPALRAGHLAARSWPPRSSTSWRCPLRTCATAHSTNKPLTRGSHYCRHSRCTLNYPLAHWRAATGVPAPTSAEPGRAGPPFPVDAPPPPAPRGESAPRLRLLTSLGLGSPGFNLH